MDFKMDQKELVQEFWEGRENLFIRLYTYCRIGLNAINDAKYLVGGIIALYAILKFTNPLWMVVVAVGSIPVLIVLGRWQLYKVSKVSEWVSTTRGSVLGYNNYKIQVEQLELLREIRDMLKK